MATLRCAAGKSHIVTCCSPWKNRTFATDGVGLVSKRRVQGKRFKLQMQWSLFAFLSFLSALFIAWHTLAKVDFFYPLWYEMIGIERTIAEYGPQNRYKRHFESTSEAERIGLFSDIVTAIHAGGRGLDALAYHDADGRVIDRLLTGPEIVHLQDVARLIEYLQTIGWVALAGWGMLLGLAIKRGWRVPSVKGSLLRLLAILVSMGLLIVAIGPVRVFYLLHDWVFPSGHQWFFYYQESLMTTMMKAPDLFGYIAVVLLGLSVLIFSALILLARALMLRCAKANFR